MKIKKLLILPLAALALVSCKDVLKINVKNENTNSTSDAVSSTPANTNETKESTTQSNTNDETTKTTPNTESLNEKPSSTTTNPISSSISTKPNNSKPIVTTVTIKKSKLYLGTLNYSLDLPTYLFSETPSIPYVGIEDYFVNTMNQLFDSGDAYSIDGASIVNNTTKETLDFDVENNIISSDDFDHFNTSSSNMNDPINILTLEYDPVAQYSDETTYQNGGKTTFDLSRYGANLKLYKGKIYVPFSFVETIIDGSSPYRFIFNGNDYYLYRGIEYMANEYGGYTDYAKSFYNGSLTKNISQEYQDYIYNSFLFTMENFNGHFHRLNIDSLDKKLEEDGYKSLLCSTNPETSNAAMAEVVNKYFCDGGHTAFMSRGFGCEYDSYEDLLLRYGILDYDTRYTSSRDVSKALEELRGSEITKNLIMEDETAVIRFDDFTAISNNYYYDKEMAESDTASTFGILYNSFEKIKQNPNIKNVVFDVSLNGGGHATALGEALSFMTNDPVKLTVRNTLTNSITTAAVKYDNDLDGDYNDDDSYEGKYNFYILTSNASFSCANEFPVIAKEYGYAKIIGETSGGGDCSTVSFVAPDATNWVMSSFYSFTDKNNDIDFDLGATPDYTLDYSYFYDISKLNQYLSTITK